MNLLWISATGKNLAIAEVIVKQGHNVAVYSAPGAQDGPFTGRWAEKEQLWPWASNADLIVIDSPFPLERTRTSWKPSAVSLFIDELRRKHDRIALGPTPTLDLLVGDSRYLGKWCRRLGIDYGGPVPDGAEPWVSSGWFRRSEVVTDGPYLKRWADMFQRIGFRGWFELHGFITPGGVRVTGCDCALDPMALPDPDRIPEFLQEMAR